MERHEGIRCNSFIYLSQDNHTFKATKKKGTKTYLECRIRGCSVTVVLQTTNNVILNERGSHIHSPEPLIRDILSLRRFLRSESESTNRSFDEIFLEGERLYQGAAVLTGGLDFYRSMMQRSRANTN